MKRFDGTRDVLVGHRSENRFGGVMTAVRERDRFLDGGQCGNGRCVRRIFRIGTVRGFHGEPPVARRLGEEFLLGVDVKDQLARRAQRAIGRKSRS